MGAHMTKTSRRAVLAGGIATAVATSSTTAHATPDSWVEAVWTERIRLLRQLRDVERRMKDAKAQLPEWAAAGPAFIDNKGQPCGRVVGWPRREFEGLPNHQWLVRESPHDIRQMRDLNLNMTKPGSEKSLEVRANAVRRMKAFQQRRRLQRDEELRLGIPALEDENQRLSDEIYAAEIALREMAQSGNLEAVMAHALIEDSYETQYNGDDRIAIITIRALLPLLPQGTIATAAAHFMSTVMDPEAPEFEWSHLA